MRDGRVGAVFFRPVGRRPRVGVEVADAGVVRGDPVGGEVEVEDRVGRFEDQHVGVEVADAFELRVGLVELENAQLGPGVGEAGGDEVDVDVFPWEKCFGLVEKHVGFRGFQLKSTY